MFEFNVEIPSFCMVSWEDDEQSVKFTPWTGQSYIVRANHLWYLISVLWQRSTLSGFFQHGHLCASFACLCDTLPCLWWLGIIMLAMVWDDPDPSLDLGTAWAGGAGKLPHDFTCTDLVAFTSVRSWRRLHARTMMHCTCTRWHTTCTL